EIVVRVGVRRWRGRGGGRAEAYRVPGVRRLGQLRLARHGWGVGERVEDERRAGRCAGVGRDGEPEVLAVLVDHRQRAVTGVQHDIRHVTDELVHVRVDRAVFAVVVLVGLQRVVRYDGEADALRD